MYENRTCKHLVEFLEFIYKHIATSRLLTQVYLTSKHVNCHSRVGLKLQSYEIRFHSLLAMYDMSFIEV